MSDILSQDEVDALLNAVGYGDIFFKPNDWRGRMGNGRYDVTKCEDCIANIDGMCQSNSNCSREIDELKRGWKQLDEHVPENMRGEEYDKVIAYFLEVMESINKNGLPLPKCTFNNSCFQAKPNDSEAKRKEERKDDLVGTLDALFGGGDD